MAFAGRLTRRNLVAGALGGVALTADAAAMVAARPVVVELFTSQGCSSCPPADAYLRELARAGGELLPLAFHVTYWDRLGWRDPFALEAATARQRRYAAISGIGSIYTPQMVVDGVQDVVGSDRARVQAALARAAGRVVAAATLTVSRDGEQLSVAVGPGTGAGSVLLVGYDPEHRTAVSRGENSGRTLVEANIVRSMVALGAWTGAAFANRVAIPPGERHAVLVQAANGTYLAAASVGT